MLLWGNCFDCSDIHFQEEKTPEDSWRHRLKKKKIQAQPTHFFILYLFFSISPLSKLHRSFSLCYSYAHLTGQKLNVFYFQLGLGNCFVHLFIASIQQFKGINSRIWVNAGLNSVQDIPLQNFKSLGYHDGWWMDGGIIPSKYQTLKNINRLYFLEQF